MTGEVRHPPGRQAVSAARVREVEHRLHDLRHREPLTSSDVDVARARLDDARGRLELAVWRAQQSAKSAAVALRRARQTVAAAAARDSAWAGIPDRLGPPEAAQAHLERFPRLEGTAASDHGGPDRVPLQAASHWWLDQPSSGETDVPAAWSEEGYVHECCFFSSVADLIDVAGPPLRRAAAKGELVVLGCSDGNNVALARALGPDTRVASLPRGDRYRSAVTLLSQYRDILLSHTRAEAARVRLVVEPCFDTGPDGWDEWRRFEGLCNVLFTGFGMSQMCVYDLRAVPRAVLATAELSHPYVRSEGLRAPNMLFADPEELRRLSDPLDDTGMGLGPALVCREVHRLNDVGRRLTVLLRARNMSVRSVEDLVTALGEVTSLMVTAWAGPVTIRVWLPPRGVVCALAPHTQGLADDPDAQETVERFETLMRSRLGARLARRLSDDITTVRDSEGFSVRLTKSR